VSKNTWSWVSTTITTRSFLMKSRLLPLTLAPDTETEDGVTRGSSSDYKPIVAIEKIPGVEFNCAYND